VAVAQLVLFKADNVSPYNKLQANYTSYTKNKQHSAVSRKKYMVNFWRQVYANSI